jgi:hypothetical protein
MEAFGCRLCRISSCASCDCVNTTSEDTPRLEEAFADGGQLLAHRIADEDHAFALEAGQGLPVRAEEQLALGHGAVELQAAGGVEGLAAGDIVGEVEHRGQPDLLVRRHLVQVQAIENTGLDARGGLGHGLSGQRTASVRRRSPP